MFTTSRVTTTFWGSARPARTAETVVDRGKVRLFHIFAANPREHLAVNFHLLVRALVRGAGGSEDSQQGKEKNGGRGKKDGDFDFVGHRTPDFGRLLGQRTCRIISGLMGFPGTSVHQG